MSSEEDFEKFSKMLFVKTKREKNNWVWYNGRYYSPKDIDQLEKDLHEQRID